MGGILPPEESRVISFIWKLRLPPGHTGLLMPPNQWAKKAVTVLADD